VGHAAGRFRKNNPIGARLACTQKPVVLIVDLANSGALAQMAKPEVIDDCQRKKEAFKDEGELGFPDYHDLALLIARIHVFRRSAIH
jgi:hypothetical protein